MQRLAIVAILALAIEAGTSPRHAFDALSIKSEHSWLTIERDEQLQVILTTKNTEKHRLDIPGQFLWQVHYIPNANSVKRLEGMLDSLRQRAASGAPNFRDGPGYPRLWNVQLPEEKPRLKLSPGETLKDTLRLDISRSSYREWPGIIQMEWQFGSGWGQPEQRIPLDSLRFEIPVP